MLASIAEVVEAIPATPDAGAAEQKADESAERRPATVLFCDLIGSTALACRAGHCASKASGGRRRLS
jgi:class 3 adenylate cyclase